ncbi:MAG TPA: hypothetical protein VI033_02290 [Candidatus Nitrosopolaris sp.]
MFEKINLAVYSVLGFAITYLALEAAWHFRVCTLDNKTIIVSGSI